MNGNQRKTKENIHNNKRKLKLPEKKITVPTTYTLRPYPTFLSFLSFLDMNEFRQDAQAVILNKKIYVIGGRDYKGERVLDSIESFDISQGQWNRVTSVPVAREGYRCVTCRVSCNHLTPMKLK